MNFGLVNKNRGDTVPLKDIKVKAEINTFTAQVLIELTYENNKDDSALEVEFKFPLDDTAAIYHFEAIINGKSLIGKVQDKTKAEQTYSDAISAGKGAYLLSKDSPDIFTMSVGNLPPKQSVILKLGYVVNLEVEDDTVAFALTNFAPEHLSVQGPQLIYNIQLVEPHQPCIFNEINGLSNAYALHFMPNTTYRECAAELLFVLDRSGSMSGQSISQLKQTMFQVLKHLPQVAAFNIIGFGSSFEKLFPTSQPCKPKNIGVARRHVSTLQANMGGTNLTSPLKDILQANPPASVWKDKPQKIVFVLTDGQVSDRDTVLDLVKSHASRSRVFSLGIGDAVDTWLVEGLARCGKGSSLFISGQSADEMENSVVSLLHKAVEPAHENVTLDWYSDEGKKINDIVKQAPIKLPPIFNRQMYTVYGLAEFSISRVVLKVKGKSGSETFELSYSKENERTGMLIHRLAVHTLIRELEEKSATVSAADKATIIELSTTYNIASTFASFVIVEDRKEPVYETMNLSKLDTTKEAVDFAQRINATKSIMLQNIDSILQRGERIELLCEKSEDLSASSNLFYSNARTLRHRMWMKNVKLWLLVILILIIIAVTIGLLVHYLA